MRARDLLLSLDATPGTTLGQRIVEAVQKAIVEGRLLPGTALPGSRALAEMLEVNRQTVIQSLQELEAQGWLITEPNRGTFVAEELPSRDRTTAGPKEPAPALLGFDLPSFLKPVSMAATGALLLADGAADPRLAPAEELAKGYQRALRRHGSTLLQDRDPLGTPLLREAVADWIGERHGVRVDPGRILITRGSRGALALLAAILFRPGEVAAVEEPGNRGAWEILQGARLALKPVPVDAAGMDPHALGTLLQAEKVRMLYLTPRRQFPTAVSMTRERGRAILDLAVKHRLAVVEDDYDGELCYGESRPEPLLAQDRSGQVLHIGSLSRLLAPGLRLGYLVLPAPLVPFMARAKRGREEQGDPAFEWAVADLIRDGELARHLRRARKIYEERRDFLVSRLRERMGEHLDINLPGGGMGLWVRALAVDATAWVQAARSAGLMLNPPGHFHLGPPKPAFRMGFAQADLAELGEAAQRLEAALGRVRGA